MKEELRDLLVKGPSKGGPFEDPETGKSGPDWSQQSREPRVGTPPGRLHVRETLMTGQVRFHGHTETHAPSYHLLVDGGPSLNSTLEPESLEVFVEFVKAWKGHHGLRGKITVNRKEKWGPELWTQWLEGLERESPGAVVLFGDFHGALPEGPLWKVLTSRFWLRVLRFVHPKPQLPGSGEFLDCTSGERHLYEQQQFELAYQKWQEGLEAFFRKAGIDQSLVDRGTPYALAKAFIDLI